MRVFVIGSTGYIGSAVVHALVAAGHTVTGLVRTPEKARQIERMGAQVVIGQIEQPQTYRAIAQEHEVLIAAVASESSDQIMLDTLVTAATAAKTLRTIIYTSGVWEIGSTGNTPVDEQQASTANPPAIIAWRPAHERFVLQAATDLVATAAIRPALVYGGKGGYITPFFASAEKEGAAVYVGDGKNHWPLIHRDDLAQLFRLVAEKRARGVFHGVDGSALTVMEIARAASEAAGKGGNIRSIPVEEAQRTMGAPVVEALCLDQIVIAPRSHALGWHPAHPPFTQSAYAAYREWKESDY